MRKGFKKITIWGQDRYEDFEYIVASVTSTPNFYMAHRGYTDKKSAIKEAKICAKVYDEQYVVIQMP